MTDKINSNDDSGKNINPEYESLINSLIADGYLKTPEIIEAFKKIDRVDFVSKEYKGEAYGNYPLPIGFDQTISQPLTVAFMLELLQPKKGERILDIGAGSGWQTALLGSCVGETGKVVGVERIFALAEKAKKNIAKYNFIEKGIVEILCADGSEKIENQAAFDKIIAAASADEIPGVWKEEISIGGRIVAPVGQSVVVLEKESSGDFSSKEFFGFSFVPLITAEGQLKEKQEEK